MSELNYYLSVPEDFFEDETIKWLQNQDKGVECTVIYLHLLLKAIEADGYLLRNVAGNLVPHTAKTLARAIKTDVGLMELTIELLKKAGLLEEHKHKMLYLPQLKELIACE